MNKKPNTLRDAETAVAYTHGGCICNKKVILYIPDTNTPATPVFFNCPGLTPLKPVKNVNILKTLISFMKVFQSCVTPSRPHLCPGSYSRHSCTHWCLHVASALVHVAWHLCLSPRHRHLPHLVWVVQPVWYDATWTQPRPGVLLLLSSKCVLRHSLRENGGHQAAKVLDRPPADEPLGHLLSVLSVHLHC